MNKQEFESAILANVLESIQCFGGNDLLSSIILTGSFGRGELSYAKNDDGKLILKSDIEIALVYSKNSKRKAVKKLACNVARHHPEDLNLMCINERRVKKGLNFNGTVLPPRYFTVFSYDLYHGSKTIWGEDFISVNPMKHTPIDLYEAKRLVANRIGELVWLKQLGRDQLTIEQWQGKLILALGSAWLICEEEYVSSYAEQYDKLKKMSQRVDADIGAGFFQLYEQAYMFLRVGGHPTTFENRTIVSHVSLMDDYFGKKSIYKSRVNSASRVLKYWVKYIQTGIKFGVFKFEDNILQSLITEYCKEDMRVLGTARVWHEVMY